MIWIPLHMIFISGSVSLNVKLDVIWSTQFYRSGWKKEYSALGIIVEGCSLALVCELLYEYTILFVELCAYLLKLY